MGRQWLCKQFARKMMTSNKTKVIIRLTLADDKNKNRTENTFLFLPTRHKTALAI